MEGYYKYFVIVGITLFGTAIAHDIFDIILDKFFGKEKIDDKDYRLF